MSAPDREVPTLAAWAGGEPALAALTERFYAKVAADPLLAPVFAHMSPAHAERVAAFITEVFRGPKVYAARGGSHGDMVAKHMGRALSEAQRRRWIELILDAADEVGLPADPEFRAAFVGYLEWGSRLAVLNSQPGAPAPEPGLPMPAWDWGPPGGPYSPGA